MPRELWSVDLDGADLGDLLVQSASHRIVVSMTRRQNEPSSGGLSSAEVRVSDGTRYYQNTYADHCLALDPSGIVAWQAAGMNVLREQHDGSLLVAGNRDESVTLDVAGLDTIERSMSGCWEVLGLREDESELSVRGPGKDADSPDATAGALVIGAVWVGQFAYWLHDDHLHRYDAEGVLVSKALVRKGSHRLLLHDQNPLLVGLWPPWYEPGSPVWWDLVFDPSRRRLLATTPEFPAWVMALDMDGSVEWVTLVGEKCCNFRCILLGDDVIVHGSSCGGHITFMTSDGVISCKRDLSRCLCQVVSHGEGHVLATVLSTGVVLLDKRGEPTWNLEAPTVEKVVADGSVVYVVTRSDPRKHRLTAFDV